MNKQVRIRELYDCQTPYLRELFDRFEFPWEMLPHIKDYA